jgi:DNA invertase Pin-like site-specific DNA recombinase
MTEIPPDLQARRAVEDELVRLGSKRNRLESELAANIEAIVAAIPKAIETGIPFDGVAKLVGVSRQTLYRWQEVARRLME